MKRSESCATAMSWRRAASRQGLSLHSALLPNLPGRRSLRLSSSASSTTRLLPSMPATLTRHPRRPRRSWFNAMKRLARGSGWDSRSWASPASIYGLSAIPEPHRRTALSGHRRRAKRNWRAGSKQREILRENVGSRFPSLRQHNPFQVSPSSAGCRLTARFCAVSMNRNFSSGASGLGFRSLFALVSPSLMTRPDWFRGPKP